MFKATLISLLCLSSLACDLTPPSPTEPSDSLETPTVTSAALVVRPPPPPPVDASKELFITALEVVDDRRYVDHHPGRFDQDADGGWSFARLVDNLIATPRPTDVQRSQFVMQWLRTWETPQHINSQTLAARPAVRDVVITPWKLRSAGKLGNTPTSCTAAPSSDATCVLSFGPNEIPFELIAIVNRADLRVLGADPTASAAAQGRFVFALVDAERNPLPMTVIFEYMVPTSGLADTKAYAEAWHRLGAMPFGPQFNQALQQLTRRFMRKNAAPWRNNGSALLQLRTNEVMFAAPDSDPANPFGGGLWELREFIIANGRLTPDTVKMEPRQSLSGTPLLSQWAKENSAAILAGTASMPATYRGQAFLGASAPAPFEFAWDVPGVSDDVRDALALGTCNGCHVNETGTGFLHVFPGEAGVPATLSPFLEDELANARKADFRALFTNEARLMTRGPGLDHGRPPR